jgi:hypothetical protein
LTVFGETQRLSYGRRTRREVERLGEHRVTTAAGLTDFAVRLAKAPAFLERGKGV